MSIYDPLREYLKRLSVSMIPMTFREIEGLLKDKLPPSAYKHRPWWSNNPSNSVITHAWLDAGFHSESVDMSGKKLVFRRVRAETAKVGMAEEARDFQHGDVMQSGRHPLIGALKGLLRIKSGYDLTQPTWDDDDEKAFNEKWDRLLK